MTFEFDEAQKQALTTKQENNQKILQKAQSKGLTLFGQENKQPQQEQPQAQVSQQIFSMQLPTQPKYIPTGVKYYDDKLASGKGFNFLEAYVAKNMLGIDLRAHINMKQDQKTRNLTTFYQELYKQAKALDSIDIARSSDLYHASGYGGAIKTGATNIFGKQWNEATERSKNALQQAIIDITNARKISGMTGKDQLNRTEDRIAKNLTDSVTRTRALNNERDIMFQNMQNSLRLLEQMGGDIELTQDMKQWIINTKARDQILKEREKLPANKRYDKNLEHTITKSTYDNPFAIYAMNVTQGEQEE